MGQTYALAIINFILKEFFSQMRPDFLAFGPERSIVSQAKASKLCILHFRSKESHALSIGNLNYSEAILFEIDKLVLILKNSSNFFFLLAYFKGRAYFNHLQIGLSLFSIVKS